MADAKNLNLEKNRQKITEALQRLNFIDEYALNRTENTYDYILLLGGIETTFTYRLNYLLETLKNHLDIFVIEL